MEAKREIRLQYRILRKGGSHADWSIFIAEKKKVLGEEKFKSIASSIFEENDRARERLRKYAQSGLVRFRIRKYCNMHLWTDVEPYEVVAVISERKVMIRMMDAELVEAPRTFHAGGFLGHTENSEQRWKCTSNEIYDPFPITLTKKGWGKGRYRMSDEPLKFYDYNF